VPTALVVQEAHYDPWGLELAPLGYNAPQNAEDRFKFNGGSERETGLGLHWDETPFRPYDAQLGRFHGIDALADMFPGITPMHFGYNNPVLFNDPSGLKANGPCPCPTTRGDCPCENQPPAPPLSQQKGSQTGGWIDVNPNMAASMLGIGPGQHPFSSNGDGIEQKHSPPMVGIWGPSNQFERWTNTLLGKEYLNKAHDFYRNNLHRLLLRYCDGGTVYFILYGKHPDDNYIVQTFTNTTAVAVVEGGFDLFGMLVWAEATTLHPPDQDVELELGQKTAVGFPAKKYRDAFLMAYPKFMRFF
jgi:RHS repeat-associated protein